MCHNTHVNMIDTFFLKTKKPGKQLLKFILLTSLHVFRKYVKKMFRALFVQQNIGKNLKE